MRIKVERKIASSETISVRRVKGKGSTCGMPGIELKTSQLPNQITFTHTNVMLPQKLEILSARRSVCVLRSEEHTSELQSLAYLVCRLLLEKKKKKNKKKK